MLSLRCRNLIDYKDTLFFECLNNLTLITERVSLQKQCLLKTMEFLVSDYNYY